MGQDYPVLMSSLCVPNKQHYKNQHRKPLFYFSKKPLHESFIFPCEVFEVRSKFDSGNQMRMHQAHSELFDVVRVADAGGSLCNCDGVGTIDRPSARGLSALNTCRLHLGNF